MDEGVASVAKRAPEVDRKEAGSQGCWRGACHFSRLSQSTLAFRKSLGSIPRTGRPRSGCQDSNWPEHCPETNYKMRTTEFQLKTNVVSYGGWQSQVKKHCIEWRLTKSKRGEWTKDIVRIVTCSSTRECVTIENRISIFSIRNEMLISIRLIRVASEHVVSLSSSE